MTVGGPQPRSFHACGEGKRFQLSNKLFNLVTITSSDVEKVSYKAPTAPPSFGPAYSECYSSLVHCSFSIDQNRFCLTGGEYRKDCFQPLYHFGANGSLFVREIVKRRFIKISSIVEFIKLMTLFGNLYIFDRNLKIFRTFPVRKVELYDKVLWKFKNCLCWRLSQTMGNIV